MNHSLICCPGALGGGCAQTRLSDARSAAEEAADASRRESHRAQVRAEMNTEQLLGSARA